MSREDKFACGIHPAVQSAIPEHQWVTGFHCVSGHPLDILFLAQVIGRLFAPSQKSKKLSHHLRVCFELGIGILNAPRKIFLFVYEPILKLQGLVAVEFQGKNCFKKMASNFSEIDCGFR